MYKRQLVIGLDQASNDSFVMPVKKEVEVYEDEALHRHQRQGYYGWAEIGFGVLDNRRVLAGSFNRLSQYHKKGPSRASEAVFLCIYRYME